MLNPEEECSVMEYVRTLRTEGVPVYLDTLMMVAVHICSITRASEEQLSRTHYYKRRSGLNHLRSV